MSGSTVYVEPSEIPSRLGRIPNPTMTIQESSADAYLKLGRSEGLEGAELNNFVAEALKRVEAGIKELEAEKERVRNERAS